MAEVGAADEPIQGSNNQDSEGQQVPNGSARRLVPMPLLFPHSNRVFKISQEKPDESTLIGGFQISFIPESVTLAGLSDVKYFYLCPSSTSDSCEYKALCFSTITVIRPRNRRFPIKQVPIKETVNEEIATVSTSAQLENIAPKHFKAAGIHLVFSDISSIQENATLRIDVFLANSMVSDSLNPYSGKVGKRTDPDMSKSYFSLLKLCHGIRAPKLNLCSAVECEWNQSLAELFSQFFDRLFLQRSTPKPFDIDTTSLTVRLRPYQRDAVRFMIGRELEPAVDMGGLFDSIPIPNTSLHFFFHLCFFAWSPSFPSIEVPGGILADEMGLGKTVELLALIASHRKGQPRPSLSSYSASIEDEDDVKEALNEMVSNVVAMVDSEKIVARMKEKRNISEPAFFFTLSSPTKKNSCVRCEQCGIDCAMQRVHWSVEMSSKHVFHCPNCMAQKDKPPVEIAATLIVVPSTILQQWHEEIRRHVREDVKVDVYRGVRLDGYKHPRYLAQSDIVLTTYDALRSDYGKFSYFEKYETRQKTASRVATTPLLSVVWWRICLDESQSCPRSLISALCSDLRSHFRWSVSGTPLTKGIDDVRDAFSFLGLAPLSNSRVFSAAKSCFMQQLEPSLHSFLLHVTSQVFWRTAKKNLTPEDRYKPVVHRSVEWVTLSPLEERLYSTTLEKAKQKLANLLGFLADDTPLQQNPSLSDAVFSILLNIRVALLTTGTVKQTAQITQKLIGRSVVCSNEAMYSHLMRGARHKLSSQIRTSLLNANATAGLFWLGGNLDDAFSWYKYAVRLILESKKYSELMGVADSAAASAGEDNEAGSDEEEGGEVDLFAARPVPPITCDAVQLVHIYRNLQWLGRSLGSAAEFLEESVAAGLGELLSSAIRRFYDFEEKALVVAISEWEKIKLKREKEQSEFGELDVEWVKEYDGGRSAAFIDSFINSSRKLQSTVEECIQVACFEESLEEDGSEEEYRKSYLTYSPLQRLDRWLANRPQNDELSDGEEDLSDPPSKKRKEVPLETSQQRKHAEEGVTLRKELNLDVRWERLSLRERYNSCVRCVNDGVYPYDIFKNCILCSMAEFLKQFKTGGKLSKPEMAFHSLLRLTEGGKGRGNIDLWRIEPVAEKSRGKQLASLFSFSFRMVAVAEKLLVPVLEKMNRLRELRQSTLRMQAGMVVVEILNQRITLREGQLELELLGEYKQRRNEGDRLIAENLAQIRYIKSLETSSGSERKGTADKESGRSSPPEAERECPICLAPIGDSWFIFPCAHAVCPDCGEKQDKLAGRRSSLAQQCVVCRASYQRKAVLFVTRPRSPPAISAHSHSSASSSSLLPNDVQSHMLNLTVKYEAVARKLLTILRSDTTAKVLLFSSLPPATSLLRRVLETVGIPLATFSTESHHHVIARFRNDPNIRVLLMPLRSGGKGLNLTVANHVMFVEPVIDISAEEQAIGRVDRIGQRRPVHVHYLVIRDTIEHAIHEMMRSADCECSKWTVGTLRAIFNFFQD